MAYRKIFACCFGNSYFQLADWFRWAVTLSELAMDTNQATVEVARPQAPLSL